MWDDGGWFKIFDHDTGAYDNNLIDCIEGSCEWDGTERRRWLSMILCQRQVRGADVLDSGLRDVGQRALGIDLAASG